MPPSLCMLRSAKRRQRHVEHPQTSEEEFMFQSLFLFLRQSDWLFLLRN